MGTDCLLIFKNTIFFLFFFFLQVRATNLQELVYKNGQAGITKATVSITFDNSDKKQSPLGYEQYDEITVTRQVGYYIFMSKFSFYQTCKKKKKKN